MADTPMMKQYLAAKRACPDALLLFRMGDFYELFYDDAKTAAAVLGLALTSREKGAGAVPMAGFPHHQLDSYLGKIIAAGYRAAVCEQVEDPKTAKGLVRREITRVVTPGTITDEALLDPRESNYLAAIAPGEPAGLAWVDLSTGRFMAAAFPAAQLADQLARLEPSECLLSDDAPPPAASGRLMVTRRPAWEFSTDAARQTLSKHFGTASLEGFGFNDSAADNQAVRAAGAVLAYLQETQKTSLAHLDRLLPYRSSATLEIDQAARRGLELVRTIREGRREGSLLAVLDRTVTAMGSRLLGEWLANPLTDIAAISARHQAIAQLLAQPAVCGKVRDALRQVYDLERLLARATTGRATPRDLNFLARTLAQLPAIKASLVNFRAPENLFASAEGFDAAGCAPTAEADRSALLAQLEAELDPCETLHARLSAALRDECPLSCREGDFIRDGFSTALDELRQLARGGKQWIARYQAEQISRTGISSLRVGFNQVFGYYIEVTNAHRDKVPPDYVRKQTLKNAERYITPELKEYEEKVLTADEQAKQLEYELFVELREAVAAARQELRNTAAVLAQLDVLAALAELARARNYCRPQMVAEPVLRISDGRHPVLEAIEPAGSFVPNDTECGGEDGNILLITGPNMAGKSTYIRQVALIVIMAQLGSFVPARSATIGVADRVFARVGASDELSRGQSTFMVEMTETARILNTATPRSLVILDEIGRGTSTYDGISLAWAVMEYLAARIRCRTLFATHYHELTDLEKVLPNARNLNVAVREWQDSVIFLHKIIPGAADKSYGIHVARLAGVPREVVERGKEILAQLEAAHLDAEGRAKFSRPSAASFTSPRTSRQLSLFGAEEHPLLDELRRLDLTTTTPLAALELLHRWQASLAGRTPNPPPRDRKSP
jgi:DNA mismatch repair protein MutS